MTCSSTPNRDRLREEFDDLLANFEIPLAVTLWVERWLSEDGERDLDGWQIHGPSDAGRQELQLERHALRTPLGETGCVLDHVLVRTAQIKLVREVRTRSRGYEYLRWRFEGTYSLPSHECLEIQTYGGEL